jgi:hypothetical protein
MSVWKLGGITTTRLTIIQQLVIRAPEREVLQPQPRKAKNYEAVKRKGQVPHTLIGGLHMGRAAQQRHRAV